VRILTSAADSLGSQRTVLYIEDNPASVRLVELFLEQRSGVRLIGPT
jgi:hypothetical protein